MPSLKRHVVEGDARGKTIAALQACLVDLIDLSLQGKQAHWNVVGPHFTPIHELLDAIVDTAREASDEVAERIVTLAEPADGLVTTVAEKSRLAAYPTGLQPDAATVTLVADRLKTVIEGLRTSIEVTGETDPISEDLLIGQTAELEKHLWMVQAQEA
ncbi:MAG: DNA starvation/stationary phase protection protein [Planctomycetota bacterium]